jgi:ferredoxin
MGETHEIEFVEEGRTLEIEEDESILDAAERAGMDLPYQCRMGVCGVCCAARAENGEVDQFEGMFLSEAEQEEGYVLTCIGRPLSDLKLESNSSP